LVVSALLMCVVASAASPEPTALRDLQAEAVTASPRVGAQSARVRALARLEEVAGAWSDPMVALEYSNAPLTSGWIGDHPMSGLQVKVQQTLRPPGWSAERRAVVGARGDAAGQMEAEMALALQGAVAEIWWALARNRMLEAITREHLARTEELTDAVRARYETGAVGQHAVLRLSVLRDRLSDEVEEHARATRELQAGLAGALSREGVPGIFETPPTTTAADAPGDADWRALAEAHRPAVAAARAQASTAEAEAALARTEARVDPTVWAGYRARVVQTETDPGTDLVSLGVSVPIPLGSGRRARGEESAALERGAAAEADRESLLDTIAAATDADVAAWRRAADKAAFYEAQLLPQARATLETTRSDFVVGRADFASLFDAEVALLDLERTHVRALVQTHILRARVTARLGTDPTGGR
jgi:outer membrane protein TolC